MKLFKKAIAELIGAFVLVAFSCGTACALNAWGGNTLDLAAKDVAIALAFGLSLIAMAYSVGNVSGCHINPAVSFGVLIYNYLQPKEKRNFSFVEFLVYVVMQVAGAFLGVLALLAIFGANCGFAANQASEVLTSQGSNYLLVAFGVEAVLTCVFVFTIIGVTSQEKYQKCSGLIIGLTLVLVHIIGIPLTGTSVNPARSLAPAVFAMIFGGNIEPMNELWVFIAGPLLGALVAAFLYWIISYSKKKEVVAEKAAPVAQPVEKKEEAKPVEAKKEPAKKAAPKAKKVEEAKPVAKKLEINRVSFDKKLSKADSDLKKKYQSIKAELEAYGIKSRVSFEGDTFRLHKVAYAFITIRGKSLKVYYKLNPKKYAQSPIPVKDESSKKKYVEIPAVIKVKSDLSAKRAVMLVDDTMKEAGIQRIVAIEKTK
jgi:aquaporin Z